MIDVQEYFLAELTPLRRSILATGDAASVTWFAHLLDHLSLSRIDAMVIAGNIYDTMEDGYQAGLLEVEALESLAGAIRSTRHDYEGNLTDVQTSDHADALSAHLALYVVALGGREQLHRIMGNAGFRRRKAEPGLLATVNHLGRNVYTAVVHDLELRGWRSNNVQPISVDELPPVRRHRRWWDPR